MNKTNLLFVAALCLSGCTSQLPPPADGQLAARSLSTALDAWRRGQSPRDLQSLAQPIHFNDQLWSGGAALSGYEIGTGQPNGQGWTCPVTLTLRKSGSSSSQRHVNYQIDTQPQIVIVQQP